MTGAGRPRLPPGPRAPTLLQSAWWAARPVEFAERCRRRHGDTFTVRLAQGGRWVFVSTPADARAIFTREPAALLAGATHEVLEPLFGARSMHLIDGDDHRRQRRLLMPALHGAHLDRYAGLIAEIAAGRVEAWPAGEEFAVLPRVQEITLEVIMRGIFGFADAGEGRRVRACLERLLRLTMSGPRALAAAVVDARVSKLASRLPGSAIQRARAALGDALVAEIRERRARPATGRDLLSLALTARDERGRGLDEAELRDNLVTLVIAGHETTATALSWALHSLARCPAELPELSARIGEDAYAEAIARESLRLHPAVPLAMRRLLEPLELSGAAVPAGTNVAVCIHLLHRCERVYEHPGAFRPGRFYEWRPDPFAWVPFGGGNRRCPGAGLALLEMRLILQTILAKRRLLPTRRPAEAVSSLALRPAHGARITLRALR